MNQKQRFAFLWITTSITTGILLRSFQAGVVWFSFWGMMLETFDICFDS